jgi:8-oxo-dGTP pyrophosphatase MutT (NUDIX family)
MSSGFRQLGEDEIFKGHIIRVTQGTFEAPDGSTFSRDIVRHPGAVAVVALTDDDHVVLVRQYRAPVDDLVLELPAGIKDVDGEPPEETARRELIEEAGYSAGNVEFLTRFNISVGFTDEQTDIYLATDLTRVDQDVQGVEEQHMTVERVPLAEALSLIERGELRDAKSVVGILLTLRRLGK